MLRARNALSSPCSTTTALAPFFPPEKHIVAPAVIHHIDVCVNKKQKVANVRNGRRPRTENSEPRMDTENYTSG
jgi:hypothetical protein